MSPSSGTKPGNRRLFAAGTVVLLALGAFLLVRDYRAYRRMGEDNEALRSKIAEAQRHIKVDIPQAREHLAALEDEQIEFQYHERLPDQERLEELFDQLSDFEQRTHVDWTESSSKESRASRRKKTTGSYETLQYHLELNGTFFNICKFINLLETMPRFATIDEFTIKPVGRGTTAADGSVTCTVKLAFSVYRLTPSKAPASRKPKPTRTARS